MMRSISLSLAMAISLSRKQKTALPVPQVWRIGRRLATPALNPYRLPPRGLMSEDLEIAESGEAQFDPNALRGPDDHLNPAWIERLRQHLAAGEEHDLAEMMEPLHAADAGDVLEALE